jgi:hypothetical protein
MSEIRARPATRAAPDPTPSRNPFAEAFSAPVLGAAWALHNRLLTGIAAHEAGTSKIEQTHGIFAGATPIGL